MRKLLLITLSLPLIVASGQAFADNDTYDGWSRDYGSNYGWQDGYYNDRNEYADDNRDYRFDPNYQGAAPDSSGKSPPDRQSWGGRSGCGGNDNANNC